MDELPRTLIQGQSLATGRCINTFFLNFLKIKMISIPFSYMLEKMKKNTIRNIFWLSRCIKHLWGTKHMYCYVLKLLFLIPQSYFPNQAATSLINSKLLIYKNLKQCELRFFWSNPGTKSGVHYCFQVSYLIVDQAESENDQFLDPFPMNEIPDLSQSYENVDLRKSMEQSENGQENGVENIQMVP